MIAEAMVDAGASGTEALIYLAAAAFVLLVLLLSRCEKREEPPAARPRGPGPPPPGLLPLGPAPRPRPRPTPPPPPSKGKPFTVRLEIDAYSRFEDIDAALAKLAEELKECVAKSQAGQVAPSQTPTHPSPRDPQLPPTANGPARRRREPSPLEES